MAARELDIPAGLRIRPLEMVDLQRVIEIENSSFSTPWRRPTFESLLGRRDSDLIAAEGPYGLVGYAVVWTIVDQSELGNVAVARDQRGLGIGRLLVRTALDRATARGAEDCFLEVRESNVAARALYETCGFEVIGRRRRYYTRPVEDALVMRAHLL